MRSVINKQNDDIASEWDKIAHLRYQQITNGQDVSFEHVLLPSILSLSAHSDHSQIIDVGCGIGVLSEFLFQKSSRLVGVDLSLENIQIARQRLKHNEQTSFIQATIEDYARDVDNRFTLAVANMTLMTGLSLTAMVKAVHKVLVPDGHFIFTITHPCFWPLYWGYAEEDWFDYNKEIIIEAPFKITLDSNQNLVTTHIHRPLENYIKALHTAGFVIDELIEPMPKPEIEHLYPEPWKYPRFMGFRCIRK